AVLDQVQIAIDSANVILLVVNARDGVVPLDREVAERLRHCAKPVLVAANKVDTANLEIDADQFAELGFDRTFPVSAIHDRGVCDLMDAAVALLPNARGEGHVASGVPDALDPAPLPVVHYPSHDPLKLAIVGRPNVGKSSLINALTRSERVIVSPIPGTTRDAVDVPFEVETDGVRQSYILIDTAGMRKTRRIDDSIEFFSVQRSEACIARSDLVVFVLDAEAGITEQDKKIGGKILEERKACIVVVNKWDLVEEAVRTAREEEIARRKNKAKRRDEPRLMTTLAEFGEWVQESLFFL